MRIWGLPKNVLVFGWASLLGDFSSELAIRTLPLFLSNVLGVKTSVIGLIEGIADSTATLTRLLSGWLSDRFDKRMVFVSAGYGLSSLVKPLLYFAASWPFVLLLRFLDRVGKGVRTAPRDALIADSCTPGEVGRAFGFNKTMDPLGAVLGLLAAAGLVYYGHGETHTLSRVIYQYLVLLAAVPGVLSFALVVVFVRDVPRNIAGSSRPTIASARLDANFKRYLAVLFMFTLGNSSDAFLVLRAQNIGMTIAEIFAMLAAFNLISAMCSYPAGRLSDRLGRKKLITAGWLVYGGVYLGFALATEPLHVWMLYLVYGAYDGLTAGVEKALVADIVGPSVRGAAYGLYSTAIGIAALPASLAAGFLWQVVGPAAPFYFGSVLAAMALLVLNLLVDAKRPDLISS